MRQLHSNTMSARLLVVDDDETVCAYFSTILTGADFDVDTAPSGERALEMLRSHRYDVLLTDLSMAGMDGLALAKAAAEAVKGMAPKAMKAKAATEAVKGKAMKTMRAKAAAEAAKGKA